MPGLGPPPKLNALGHGRQQERRFRVIRPDGAVHGPELPEAGPDGGGWCARTREWWQCWRTSAQARLFSGTDWEWLLVAAALHHVMWTEPRPELAGELRLWTAKVGACLDDRARLRVRVMMNELEGEGP